MYIDSKLLALMHRAHGSGERLETPRPAPSAAVSRSVGGWELETNSHTYCLYTWHDSFIMKISLPTCIFFSFIFLQNWVFHFLGEMEEIPFGWVVPF